MSTLNAEDLVGRFEARLDTVAGAELVDRLTVGAKPTGKAHQGVHVEIPNLRNTGQLRDKSQARVEDTVRVVLTWRIAQGDQKSSRNAALALARSLREAVTDLAWMRGTLVGDVTYEAETRTVAGGWMTLVQTYTVARLATLGG